MVVRLMSNSLIAMDQKKKPEGGGKKRVTFWSKFLFFHTAEVAPSEKSENAACKLMTQLH